VTTTLIERLLRRPAKGASRIRAAWFAAITVVVVVVMPARAGAESQRESKAKKPRPAQIEHLAGRYRFAGGQPEIDALEAAVDDVVGEMNILVRGIARRRLREVSKIPHRIAISLRGRMLTVTAAGALYAAPLDRSPVKVRGPSGDQVWLRHRDLGNGQLMQHFASDDGIRVNICRPLAGNRMRIHVTIHSDELPKDLSYAMTFSRRVQRRQPQLAP
jgi:hypothetical protein